MMRLAIRLDHLIRLRTGEPPAHPEPAALASEATFGGADRVVVRLCAEREPLRDRDLRVLRDTATCGLEVEIAPDEALVDTVLEARPAQVVLIGPEEGGSIESTGRDPALVDAIDAFRTADIPVAVIVAPDPKAVLAAQELGITFVRLDTGRLGRADTDDRSVVAFREIRECARIAGELGLRVQAGGALDARTAARVAEVAEVEQIVVGQSVAARAAFAGLQAAVRELRQALRDVRVPFET